MQGENHLREKGTIRFGGRESGGTFLFELSGGTLALDFVNTLDERATAAPVERLTTYKRLLDWCVQADLVSRPEAAGIGKIARAKPSKAEQVLRLALELRETIFSLVLSAVRGDPVNPIQLDKFNTWMVKAAQHRPLVATSQGLSRKTGYRAGELDAMLWPLVESAAEILSDSNLRSRLRLCGGKGCLWAFLDYSRHRNRRWCDMSVCGNREKIRRHRRNALKKRRKKLRS